MSGGGTGVLYSGGGSHIEAYVVPYCNLIKNFISEYNIAKICDLGCGDFNVASQYINDFVTYDGVDIVQNVVEHHNKNYATDKIHFYCLDIVEDELPDAELCLVRQVLQHLSNEEVKKVLNKIKKYKYVIITEDVFNKESAQELNADIVHGNLTRVVQKSGLYFDEAPFYLRIETLLEVPCNSTQKLVSVLIRNEP